MEEGTKEFYNQQINELHKIIANYEQIVQDYVALVSSMQEEICNLQNENVAYFNRIHELEGSGEREVTEDN